MRPVILALCASASVLGVAPTAPAQDAAAMTPVAAETLAEVGRTRVLVFRLAAPAAADGEVATTPRDPAVAEMVTPARYAKGHALAFARVRGVAAGTTRVSAGAATVTLRVVPPRTAPDVLGHLPRIATPVPAAFVWDTIGVAVEWLPPGGVHDPQLALRLPDGSELAPTHVSHPAHGPVRRADFEVSTARWPDGTATLTALARDGAGPPAESQPLAVVVARPATVQSAEAESLRDTGWPALFPELFAEAEGGEVPRLAVAIDADASGQEHGRLTGFLPPLTVAVDVAAPGLYQVLCRARGPRLAGAPATLAVLVDRSLEAVTSSPIVGERWRRVPIGRPLALAPGRHHVSLVLGNEFYADAVGSRTVDVDTIEIARFDPDAAGRAADAGPAMGMAAMVGGARRMTPVGSAEEYDRADAPLGIAFADPLEGREATGGLAVAARCRFGAEDAPRATPPRVTLHVNGRPVAAQTSAAPRFWVDAGWFQPGVNSIRLLAANAAGERAATAAQGVTWGGPSGRRGLRHLRLTVHDPAWGPELAPRLRWDPELAERAVLRLTSGARIDVPVPAEVRGRWVLLVEGRAEAGDGAAPRLAVEAWAGPDRLALHTMEIPDDWVPGSAGMVDLPPRAVRLVLTAIDAAGGHVDVQAVTFVEVGPDDVTPPEAALVWPVSGTTVHAMDAVVAVVRDDRAAEWAELLVDGRPTGLRITVDGRTGPLVFPLLARGLSPGGHTVAVRARDGAAHVTDSAAVPIVVVAEAPAAPGRFARAVRLLDRVGYGPDAASLAAVLTAGEAAWLSAQVAAADSPAAGDAAALEGALGLYYEDGDAYALAGLVLHHATLTPYPARARLVRWIENHFSFWVEKTEGAPAWDAHAAFQRAGAAPFPDLLWLSASSAAMLRYLDQAESFAGGLNENYARELLELHTVGVDAGYTQADVEALARVLTGWTFTVEGEGRPGDLRRATFQFAPELNDAAPRTVFGLRLPAAGPAERFDRARWVLEMLAAHPATARFVCRKLAEHTVGVPAPPPVVDAMAAAFLRHHGDLAAVLAAAVAHPHFEAAPDRLCSPQDFALRFARTAGMREPWALIEFCERSGQGVFGRPAPDGYPEHDAAWADSNGMVQRWRLALDLEWALLEGVPVGFWERETVDDAFLALVVDWFAWRLRGQPLSARTHAAILAALGGEDDRGQLLLRAARLVAQSPEAQLR